MRNDSCVFKKWNSSRTLTNQCPFSLLLALVQQGAPIQTALVAGMTATVIVRDGKDSRWSDISSSWSALVGGVSDLFRGTQDIQKSLAGSMAPPR